jgi:diacylglycerol kinase family enzyme
MNQSIKHLFIINPKSFWKKTKQNQIVVRIHEFFREKENTDYEIFVSRFPRDAVSYIPLFAKNLPESTILRVYAVGGDGILFDCLNGVVGLENAELAAIPYGYTNNFIQGFSKSERFLFRVLSRQYDAPSVPMDIMRCGKIYGLNYCVTGIEAEAVYYAEEMRGRMEKGHSLSQLLGRRLYTLFYYFGALSAFSEKKLPQQHYEVEVDGERHTGSYQGFSIFNSPYYGGNMHPINNAMPNDGILDMLTIRNWGFLKTVTAFPLYTLGFHKMFPRNFALRQGKKISIRSEEILRLSIDGELFYESEIDVEILPAAIKFVDVTKHGYKGVRS